MRVSLIAAMDRNRVIGKDGGLPWHLPEDLKHFKAVTMGKPVIMGRKTHESIGRPLPGRLNIVLTGDAAYSAEGCSVAHSAGEALAAAGDVEEVMVIGGAAVYAEWLPRAARLYLTLIDAEAAGDAYFPAWDPAEWVERSRREVAGDGDAHGHAFVTYDRR